MNSFAHLQPSLAAVNENTVLLRFDAHENVKASVALAAFIAALAQEIQREFARCVDDCVPAYTTILFYIDSEHIALDDFCTQLRAALTRWQAENRFANFATRPAEAPLVQLPVYYHPEVALDLEALASAKNLGVDEVISLHLQTEYTVYSVGFAPGFAYMGNVDARIATPRLATPHKRVPKGSVGIAGWQTGVYPQALPGGWNIIGRCPLPLFTVDAQGAAHCPYKMGDRVRFYAVEREQFLALGGEL